MTHWVVTGAWLVTTAGPAVGTDKFLCCFFPVCVIRGEAQVAGTCYSMQMDLQTALQLWPSSSFSLPLLLPFRLCDFFNFIFFQPFLIHFKSCHNFLTLNLILLFFIFSPSLTLHSKFFCLLRISHLFSLPITQQQREKNNHVSCGIKVTLQGLFTVRLVSVMLMTDMLKVMVTDSGCGISEVIMNGRRIW